LKKIILSLLFVIALTPVYAQNELEIKNVNLWGRAALHSRFHKNFGGFLMLSSRYNIESKKKLNGVESELESQDAFLQEIFAGPTFHHRFNDSLRVNTSLLYHPQFFYIDEQGGESYTRHTLDWHINVFYHHKPFTFRYRTIAWNWIPEEKHTPDHELYNRHLVGINYALNSVFSLALEEEIWLHYTPDESKGEDAFFRNTVFAGFNVKPFSNSRIDFRYAYMKTFASSTSVMEKTLTFHYFILTFHYFLNLMN
jgi:hypothetical protein